MICYRDMTFCNATDCKKFGDGKDYCWRSYTEEVKAAADKWWGKMEGNAPICMWVEQPDCFEEKEKC